MTKKTVFPFTKEFPALGRRLGGRRMIYLDSACTALKLKSAAVAHNELLLHLGGCGGRRSSHALARAVEERFDWARTGAAAFTGAESADEIIFTSGATEAANIFAGAFPFTPARNEVILSPLEHNSVFLPFYNLSKAGKIKLKVMPLKGFKPDIKAFERMLSKRTALVCAARASNFFGGVIDLKRIAAPAGAAGAAVFSDDAQYAPTHPVGAASSGADALAFSGHKLGAPFGTGVLWVKKALLARLNPFKVGGGVVKNVEVSGSGFKVEYLRDYQGFEAGIQNYAGAVALAGAFKTLSALGPQNIRAHLAAIVAYAYERLSAVKEIKVLGEPEDLKNGALIPFVPARRGFSPADLNIFLNAHYKDRFIAVRTGRHCADLASLSSGLAETVRLSFFVYTSKRDIDAFISALRKYLSFL
ncbi:MAG: aminotransferase class V-fold PLP-dependent enzyme [Elusimicrobia bacterium]|nr:aminotransferase class V-fold PLP-dependent enzyme [Elusimicrobiota bacterium]